MLLKAIVVVTRTTLGFFFSSALGFAVYWVALAAVVSTWDPEFVNFPLFVILAIGIGAGVGSFLAWYDKDSDTKVVVALLSIAVACALIGAWLGLLQGVEVAAGRRLGHPGVPTVSVASIGAVLAANIVLSVIGTFKIVTGPRI